jgi:hypothetical protein
LRNVATTALIVSPGANLAPTTVEIPDRKIIYRLLIGISFQTADAEGIALCRDNSPVPPITRQYLLLLEPVSDAAPLQVVGADLHLDPVAREDADTVHPHLAGIMSQYLVTVVGLYPERGVLERLDHSPL